MANGAKVCITGLESDPIEKATEELNNIGKRSRSGGSAIGYIHQFCKPPLGILNGPFKPLHGTLMIDNVSPVSIPSIRLLIHIFARQY